MIALETGTIEQLIKAQAYGLGFDLVGITTLGPAESAAAFNEWLASGYAGEMEYLARGAEKRADTRLPVPGAKSAIVVGLDYGGREPAGPVARYARGDDYHDVMVSRLGELHRYVGSVVGRTVSGKAYVDTGPILERDLARRAGLGWFGKNTMLISPRIGSFFFLGELLLDLELRPDVAFDGDRCGSCRRCLDACPTNAFTEPRVLDSTRCISYLTIELRGEIDTALRAAIGDRLYGCDICQEVCPWNRKFAQPLREEAFRPRPTVAGEDAAALAHEFLEMSEEEFRIAFRGSPMKRAKLAGLKRNATIVIGNVEPPPLPPHAITRPPR
ncbi:MAG TPA: tRNA epoxyqueuosine(34) reductase QueG [Gemmatimonadaceae bacterium]